MNRPTTDTTAYSTRTELSGANVGTQPSASVSNVKYEDVLSEKRSHWLFRFQLCLILSFLAHFGLLAYIQDKYFKLEISRLDASQSSDEKAPEPLIREPKVISGYDESRLDSPQIQDQFEQITPTSPVDEPELEKEKVLSSEDDFNTSLEHDFQTPDSPGASCGRVPGD